MKMTLSPCCEILKSSMADSLLLVREIGEYAHIRIRKVGYNVYQFHNSNDFTRIATMQPGFTITSYGLVGRDVNLLISLTSFLSLTANVSCTYTSRVNADFVFVDLDDGVGRDIWQNAPVSKRDSSMVAVGSHNLESDARIYIKKPLQTAKIRSALEQLFSLYVAKN